MLGEAIKLYPNGAPIYVAGDVTDNGTESQYVQLMAIYDEVLSSNGKTREEYPLFLAIGNHDYPSAAVVFLQYATLPDGTHPQDTSYDFWLDGYHYIFLGSDTPSGLNSYFNAETLEWLDQKLSENRDPSRPTFIFLHQPMYNTVSGSLPGEGWHGVTNESEFKAVLAKYPEVVMFNGHTHWEMNSVGNAFDGTEELPIHIFNCASVSYLWSGFNTIKGENLYGSHGYAVDIYDGRVVVRGRDFVNGLWIASAQYSFELEKASGDDITGGTECEHSFEISTLKYENGYLQKGIMKSVCAECGMEAFENTAPMIKFYGYSISTFNTNSICAGYEIDFDMLTVYEKANGVEITLGFTAAVYEYLSDEGKPIKADGTSADVTQGMVVNQLIPRANGYLDLILWAEDWTAYMDTETIICAYLLEKDSEGNATVGYICDDAVTETAMPITYKGLLDLLT